MKALLLTMILAGYCSSSLAGWEESWTAYERGDFELAVTEWKKLAEQGDKNAQINVGYAYYSGVGVQKDLEQALRWYLMAAEQGDSHAQLNAGVLYLQRQGVQQNSEEALKWLRLAAEQGEPKAMFNLGAIYANGEGGVQQNYPEAIKWFERAAEEGDVSAQEALGQLYYEGKGSPRNLAKAEHWWSIAAKGGSGVAATRLNEMADVPIWHVADMNFSSCIQSMSPADRIRELQDSGTKAETHDLPNGAVEVGYTNWNGDFVYRTYYRTKRDCVASLPRSQPIPSRYE